MYIKIAYKKQNDWFIGHLQEYPEYETQGQTLDELKTNLVEIYTDIQTGLVTDAKPFQILELEIAA